MRVLIVNGSPRPKGNTKQMIQAFCEGLETAGHEYGVYEVCKINIHGCLACEYCHTKGNGQCVQKDDVAEIAEKLRRAETIVFSTPIYFYEMSGQMKTLLDRTNPVYDSDYDFRKVYLLSVAADDAPETPERALSGLQGWIDCFEKAALAGSIFFGGIDEAGAALADPEALQKAYEFGKGLE